MTDAPKALSGNQKRKMKSASRLYAVQALFQMEHSSHSLDQVRREFLDFRFGAEVEEGEEMIDGDIDLFARLLEEAVRWQAKIDKMTDRALVAKWPIDRIDPTLRALFRAAGAELVAFDTPPKVVMRSRSISSSACSGSHLCISTSLAVMRLRLKAAFTCPTLSRMRLSMPSKPAHCFLAVGVYTTMMPTIGGP